MIKILDTSFLIDLQKERNKGNDGSAHRFLKIHEASQFAISVISIVEYEEGFSEKNIANARKFLAQFQVIELDPLTAKIAAQIRRMLRETGQLIGDFDILIAATTMKNDGSLVTANTKHFARIEGLRLENYQN